MIFIVFQEAAGSFGRYQYSLILQCSVLWALNGIAVVVWTFAAFPVGHRCAVGPACEPDPRAAVYGEQRFQVTKLGNSLQ